MPTAPFFISMHRLQRLFSSYSSLRWHIFREAFIEIHVLVPYLNLIPFSSVPNPFSFSKKIL